MADPVAHAITILNEALARDPAAITGLVNRRVECNRDLAAHGTIQTAEYGDGRFRIGILGLLNGVLGDSPTGVIGAEGIRDPRTGLFVHIHRFVDLRAEKTDILA